MQDLRRAVRHLHKGLAGARCRQDLRSRVRLQGGLNAWRKFEPDKFTDAEVETFKTEWRAAHPATIKVLARHRSCRSACGARARPGRPLRPYRSEMHRRFPAAEAAVRPQDLLPAAAASSKTNAASTVSCSPTTPPGNSSDCRYGQGAYGGLWTENIVSGIARDLLAEAMLRVEAAGYPIVLHVHDEIVCEVPIGFGSTEEFTRLMTRKPAWALELPIAASAWSGPRYCK